MTSTLSPREESVCLAASHGLTNKWIALVLNIRQCTVDSYWRRIFGKLKALGRTHAVALWLTAGAARHGQESAAAGGVRTWKERMASWTMPKGFCGELKVEQVGSQIRFYD